ncbi:hypothetical protein AB0K78_24935, partial [Streptomyces albidoflavus]
MTDRQGLRGGVNAGVICHGGFRCSHHPLLRRAGVRAGGGWGHRRGEHGEDVPPPRSEELVMMVVGIVAVCVVLAVLAFLVPRL